jgi:L-arabinose isomerase
VVVLYLQPVSALDYESADTGEWLANCSACCVPEISNAFERAGIPFNVVSGMLYKDEEAWREVEEWCRAANVAHTLRGSRFGFLGHPYPGMLDMYSDFTMHHAQLGLHVEILEMDDLKDHVDNASDDAVAAKAEEARETFELDESVAEESLDWAARVSAGGRLRQRASCLWASRSVVRTGSRSGRSSACVATGCDPPDDRVHQTFDDPPRRGEGGFERPAR